MSSKRPNLVHCEIQVCSFTPIVEDSRGNACVKYYAGKNRVLCLCYVSEWARLVRYGRIREANVPALAQSGGEKTTTKESNL